MSTEQSDEVLPGTGSLPSTQYTTASRFEVRTVQGQNVLSEVLSLAVEQGKYLFAHLLYYQKHISFPKMHTPRQ